MAYQTPQKTLLRLVHEYSLTVQGALSLEGILSPSTTHLDAPSGGSKLGELQQLITERIKARDNTLVEAELQKLKLPFINLSGANLSGANLSGADLSGADLSNTTIQGTYLLLTNLNSANLCGADLRGAVINSIVFPENNTAYQTMIQGARMDNNTKVSTGFFLRTAGEPIIDNNPLLEFGLSFATNVWRRKPINPNSKFAEPSI